MKRALIIGGTSGIGKALAFELDKRGWLVEAVGSKKIDLSWPTSWWEWKRHQVDKFDLVVFSAGYLNPEPWDKKTWGEYFKSYAINAIGPVYFLAVEEDIIKEDATIVFISSVGAINEGANDLGYGMSKAALEKAAKALNANTSYDVRLIRFDLVDTPMMHKQPEESFEGREVLTAKEAALQIVKLL